MWLAMAALTILVVYPAAIGEVIFDRCFATSDRPVAGLKRLLGLMPDAVSPYRLLSSNLSNVLSTDPLGVFLLRDCRSLMALR